MVLATAAEAAPNESRLAVACDLYDKLTCVTSSHYTALSTLRSELFAAIFEGYQDAQSDTNRMMGGVESSAGGGVSRSVGGGGGGRWGGGGLPSSRQAEEQNTHIHAASSASHRAAAPYAALTPYFVQVHRLREQLAASADTVRHLQQVRGLVEGSIKAAI